MLFDAYVIPNEIQKTAQNSTDSVAGITNSYKLAEESTASTYKVNHNYMGIDQIDHNLMALGEMEH